jgi:hypothetical protein
MSSPPKTAISYEPDYDSDPFRYVLIQVLPRPDPRTPKGVLEALDGTSWTGTDKQARAELRRRINEHARSLKLPGMLLTGDPLGAPTHYCTDLLTAATVLSKSGHGVYLRDKEPKMTVLDGGWAIMLHLPPGVPDIGEVIQPHDS